jgi:hypothetical protein
VIQIVMDRTQEFLGAELWSLYLVVEEGEETCSRRPGGGLGSRAHDDPSALRPRDRAWGHPPPPSALDRRRRTRSALGGRAREADAAPRRAPSSAFRSRAAGA